MSNIRKQSDRIWKKINKEAARLLRTKYAKENLALMIEAGTGVIHYLRFDKDGAVDPVPAICELRNRLYQQRTHHQALYKRDTCGGGVGKVPRWMMPTAYMTMGHIIGYARRMPDYQPAKEAWHG